MNEPVETVNQAHRSNRGPEMPATRTAVLVKRRVPMFELTIDQKTELRTQLHIRADSGRKHVCCGAQVPKVLCRHHEAAILVGQGTAPKKDVSIGPNSPESFSHAKAAKQGSFSRYLTVDQRIGAAQIDRGLQAIERPKANVQPCRDAQIAR